MIPSAKILTFFGVFFVVCINFTIDADSSVGICEIEVPIASILPPKLKHIAHTIRGNGTIAGYIKTKICCSGYKVASRFPLHCLPDCPDGCGLGKCTAPNICSCNVGAGLGPYGRCRPVCPTSCLNGQCYGSFCNCNTGFILGPTGKYCIPGCNRNCGPGGECVGYNQCKCHTGYRLNAQGTCEMYCNPGYKLIGNVCVPQCPRGCRNGHCTAPGRCSCSPDWTLDATGTICNRKCIYPCLNGVCSAPNICTCNQGYIKDPRDSIGNRCIPYCPGGCPNGSCSAPNFCICNYGYVKLALGSNICIKKQYVQQKYFVP